MQRLALSLIQSHIFLIIIRRERGYLCHSAEGLKELNELPLNMPFVLNIVDLCHYRHIEAISSVSLGKDIVHKVSG